jgi:hypothetical protein
MNNGVTKKSGNARGTVRFFVFRPLGGSYRPDFVEKVGHSFHGRKVIT